MRLTCTARAVVGCRLLAYRVRLQSSQECVSLAPLVQLSGCQLLAYWLLAYWVRFTIIQGMHFSRTRLCSRRSTSIQLLRFSYITCIVNLQDTVYNHLRATFPICTLMQWSVYQIRSIIIQGTWPSLHCSCNFQFTRYDL